VPSRLKLRLTKVLAALELSLELPQSYSPQSLESSCLANRAAQSLSSRFRRLFSTKCFVDIRNISKNFANAGLPQVPKLGTLRRPLGQSHSSIPIVLPSKTAKHGSRSHLFTLSASWLWVRSCSHASEFSRRDLGDSVRRSPSSWSNHWRTASDRFCPWFGLTRRRLRRDSCDRGSQNQTPRKV